MQDDQNKDIFSRIDKINVSSGYDSEETKPITLWLPVEIKEKFIELNRGSKFKLGKEIQKIVIDIVNYKSNGA